MNLFFVVVLRYCGIVAVLRYCDCVLILCAQGLIHTSFSRPVYRANKSCRHRFACSHVGRELELMSAVCRCQRFGVCIVRERCEPLFILSTITNLPGAAKLGSSTSSHRRPPNLVCDCVTTVQTVAAIHLAAQHLT